MPDAPAATRALSTTSTSSPCSARCQAVESPWTPAPTTRLATERPAIRWLIPNPRARGGTPDQAGRRTRTKPIVEKLSARTWVAIQRRYGASSRGAGVWNQSSSLRRGPPGGYVQADVVELAAAATAHLV